MKREILTPNELTAALKSLNGWTAEPDATGNNSDQAAVFLKRRYIFPDFASALEFVNRVGALSESADHHPDLSLGWGYVEIALTTHDRGGITDVDIAVARQIDSIS